MAYIHCHGKGCNWEQDDFYGEGYNPAKFLMYWNQYLFGDKAARLDEPWTDDSNFLKKNGPLTTREMMARDFEQFARRIRAMRWVTYQDFKKDPNKVCPKCGSSKLDID